MKLKSPSIILSILLVSIGISSCLDTDEVTEYSSNALLTAFGIDTIYGVEYDFEIDQIRNLVYNRDSLPVSADTILDRTLITTLSTASGLSVMSGDTIFNMEDSVNLLPAMNKSGSEGMKFTVYAADGVTTRTYTLQVRVHLQDPDSLVWKNMADEQPVFSSEATPGEQKAVLLGDELLVYTSHRSLYRTSTVRYAWGGEETVEGLPADARLGSMVAYGGSLYLVSEGREVYRSDDGLQWVSVPSLGNHVVTLIAEVNGRLAGVVEDETDGRLYFNTCDGNEWDDDGGALQEVPCGSSLPEGNFPLENLYATTCTNGNGVAKTTVVGCPAGTYATVPWTTEDGRLWVSLASDAAACPPIDNPFIAYYGGDYYIFGGNMDAIYTSETGIAWFAEKRKFLLPEAFKGNTHYSIVVEPTVDATAKRDYIWVVFGGHGAANEVWRGRLNRLGFDVQ